MRRFIAPMLALALATAPAAALADDPAHNPGLEIGTTLASSYANLLYTPAKLAVAAVGLIGGGVAGFLSGGDTRAAYAIWVPLVGGDYFVRPGVFDGTDALAFFGSDYDDQASQRSRENDRTYVYQAAYD